jgi:glycosyltransferase involved in cell wall biosynthesis
MKRALITTLHRPDRSPSQRFRIEQYLSHLQNNGWHIDFSYLLNQEDDKAFYAPGNYGQKAAILVKSIKTRLQNILTNPRYDVVFVQREAFMLGTAVFEQLLKKTGAKLIFDFDDSIWLQNVSEGNKALGFLKNPKKTDALIQIADLVFAGNNYLAEYAADLTDTAKIKIIPTTIDTTEYTKMPAASSDKICIGWSGSVSTIEHFKHILPTLRKLQKVYPDKLSFKVIGDRHFRDEELNITGLAWNKQEEVAQISSFDIGIMPLPDTEWTKGKCGLKGLQYMALEVPTIMSAVGVNTKIIKDGENGFLAATEEEWFKKMCRLIDSTERRMQMGKAGRVTVEKNYSVEAWKNEYLNYFNQLAD